MDQKMAHKQKTTGYPEWKNISLASSIEWRSTESVLGPCLFLIYINDIELNIAGEMLKLADDSKVICHIVKEKR